MPNVQFDWTRVRRDWVYQLDLLGIQQKDVAAALGISEQVMTKLLKVMTDGKGLIASPRDKYRWAKAIEYVKSKEGALK